MINMRNLLAELRTFVVIYTSEASLLRKGLNKRFFGGERGGFLFHEGRYMLKTSNFDLNATSQTVR